MVIFWGSCSPGRGRQKEIPCCSNVRILHIGTTSSKLSVSIRHFCNFGPTRTHLAPTQLVAGLPEKGPTWPIGPKLRFPGPNLSPCSTLERIGNVGLKLKKGIFPQICLDRVSHGVLRMNMFETTAKNYPGCGVRMKFPRLNMT